MLDKLRKRLSRTKQALVQKVEEVIKHGKFIDDNFFDEIEESLILADVGVKTAAKITESIRDKCRKEKTRDTIDALNFFKEAIVNILTQEISSNTQFSFSAILGNKKNENDIAVILFIGINGSGKTTTIGKMAKILKEQGTSVMFAACDTFRAAAGEQLEIWASRAGVPIVSQIKGADPSSVVFDAIVSARTKKIDVLLVDTAGRLHTKVNLMEELKKIKRVILQKSQVESSYLQTWLVLDSTLGQNSLNQVKSFNESLGIDGLILTKLDGTAKGGIVLSILDEIKIPILYVGVGEKMDDLAMFKPDEFAKAILES